MAVSKIVMENGTPKLFVNGKQEVPCAYATYFDERNRYADFAKAGYRLYSVPVAFASRALNSFTGFTPYEKGIFDAEDQCDFSILDRAVEKVLAACPDAMIFPRLLMTMPEWWCEKNPEETIATPCGQMRELLFSDKFRTDGAQMLKALMDHVDASHYAENIIGYHLADGCTEEWFHYGRKGGLCENAKKYFLEYLDQNDPEGKLDRALPDLEGLSVEGQIEDPLLRQYLTFSNVCVADTIAYFAKVVKEHSGGSKIVGTFYGYVNEVSSPLFGAVALERIIDCPDIDFFSSPNSYAGNRALGIDWGDGIPAASLKLHGKVYFSECDIRTALSDYINNCRPGADKNNRYYGDVWRGPKTVKGTVAAMRKAYAHQLTSGNALWWFDMWGGWFAHKAYMTEAGRSHKLLEAFDPSRYGYRPQLAVFADGTLYQRQGIAHPSHTAQSTIRTDLSNSGIPYDLYLLSDFEAVYQNYKAVIFPAAVDSPQLRRAEQLCKKAGIPCLRATLDKWQFTTGELRKFAESAGVHVFNRSDDVICVGNSLLMIHSATAGEKEILLPKKTEVKALCGKKAPYVTDKINVTMGKHETLIFALSDI